MNYLYRTVGIMALTAIGFATVACNKGSAKAEQESPASSQPTAQSASSPTAAQPSVAEKRTALASYERIRSSLAIDAIGAVAVDAAALEREARAVAKADVAKSQAWTGVANAAKALHGMPKDDADAVRKSFGEVSKHLLGVLSEDVESAKGLHVFECPMAQGYKKWVQPAAKISNPYMGTRMPECGAESRL